MFISDAFAQTATPMASMPGDQLFSFLPFLLILAVFWLLIWRPQMRKHKEHLDMIAALRRGDRVITSGGLIGEVTKVVDDTTVELQIADGVKVKCASQYVSALVDKGQPATTASASAKAKKKA